MKAPLMLPFLCVVVIVFFSELTHQFVLLRTCKRFLTFEAFLQHVDLLLYRWKLKGVELVIHRVFMSTRDLTHGPSPPYLHLVALKSQLYRECPSLDGKVGSWAPRLRVPTCGMPLDIARATDRWLVTAAPTGQRWLWPSRCLFLYPLLAPVCHPFSPSCDKIH